MFVENGPFVLDANLSVTLNPYSWNQVANVLYLEQPAGVGFSHPTGATNDAVTANDTLAALISFLQTHPELQGRPFYIAGESYGGHYVPNLAKLIEVHNTAAMSLKIPLNGIAVGNGYADWQLDFNMSPFRN
jgi:carboxypeptidase C (cathepsin A)